MKYNLLSAFQKQLQAAAPDHFSSIYGVFLKDPYERRYLARKVYGFLRHYRPSLEWEWISEPRELSLEGDSLFSAERFVVVDGIDKWKKSDLDRLRLQLGCVGRGLVVLLSGEGILPALFRELEKEIVALDLSGEKPWERRRRLGEEVARIVKGEGKSILLDVVEELLDRTGEDFALLKNEAEKVCCFVGERAQVTRGDVEAISVKGDHENLWRVAEGVVFGLPFDRITFKDLSEVFGMFGQLRYYLQIGLDLAAQIESGHTPSHASLKAKQLESLAPKAAHLGTQYFIKRLCQLFEMEVEAKTNYTNCDVLWDLVVIRFSG